MKLRRVPGQIRKEAREELRTVPVGVTGTLVPISHLMLPFWPFSWDLRLLFKVDPWRAMSNGRLGRA